MKLFSFILLLFNLPFLHDMGYRGEGIKIAVIDGGFYRVTSDTTIFPKDQIIGCYDLAESSRDGIVVADEQSSMFTSPNEAHGAMVLSTMLADQEQLMGTAPDAQYYLIRTEIDSVEQPKEMDNLIRGLYLADSLQADIITISLGYRYFDAEYSAQDLTYEMLNGLSPLSIAATEMAKRGHLVCVAAGNDGKNSWHYIGVPADADNILTVGACTIDSLPAAFTSYGPSYDGRIKPEVAALGEATVVYNPNSQSFIYANGTSFATPEIAGMAACLWQALPQLTAMQLRSAIIESGTQYDNADARLGYGIPDAQKVYSRACGIINEAAANNGKTVKIFQNGQVVILRDGHKYTILGIRIE